MSRISNAHQAFLAMNTVAAVAAFGGRAEHALAAAKADTHMLENRFSRFLPDSDISRLNRAAGVGTVRLHRETFEVLFAALECAKNTDGCFPWPAPLSETRPSLLRCLKRLGLPVEYGTYERAGSSPATRRTDTRLITPTNGGQAMDMHVRSFLLLVKDLPSSITFYRDVLGLHMCSCAETVAFFKEGLVLHDASAYQRYLPHSASASTPDGTVLYLATVQLEAIAASLPAAPCTLLHGVQAQPWGERCIRLLDPDGHLLEIGDGGGGAQ